MMLEAKGRVLGDVERTVLAVKFPDDVAIGSVDLVNAAGVTGGDQIVSLGVFVDAVDVEVIPRVGTVIP